MKRLLIRPGAIGDVIVSLPALEFLKADYTEVWVPGNVVPLIQFADKVKSIIDSRIEMFTPEFIEYFKQFDEVWSWYGSDQERLLAINPNCRFLKALPEQSIHASAFYLQQVGAPLNLRPKILVKSVARETIVIHPFSGSQRKNWPFTNYEDLAKRLPFPVEWAQDRFENLLELAQWIAGASLYIGNDSGITHLARAVGTPTIVIFRDSDPTTWGSNQGTILQNPTVDEVLSAANERLACARP
jgi:ADP-heptose:LPS heptosyltransferase